VDLSGRSGRIHEQGSHPNTGPEPQRAVHPSQRGEHASGYGSRPNPGDEQQRGRASELTGVPAPVSGPGGWRIEVEIGELVLTGVRRADRDQVAAAFQRELARLLRSRGLPAGFGARDAVTSLPPLPATTSPHRLGRALAQAVHTGLSDRRSPILTLWPATRRGTRQQRQDRRPG
jgi:hypothetical protein